MWVEFKSVRTVHTEGVLGDIESHAQSTTPQNDKVQLAYDTVRLINATIRNQYNKDAAYFLDNNAFVIDRLVSGPQHTLSSHILDESLSHILDELSANIAAMQVAIEYGDMVKMRARIDLAVEWLGLGATLYNTSHQKEIIDALLEANMLIREAIKHMPSMEEAFDQFQSCLPFAARSY